jgi:hypothetical protein
VKLTTPTNQRSRLIAVTQISGRFLIGTAGWSIPRASAARFDAREPWLAFLAATIPNLPAAQEVWCIFDNTASGSAIENALELRDRLLTGTENVAACSA